MNILRYSKDWADLMVAQLAATHGTRHTGVWGYGCLVVGEEFEAAILRKWHAVDRVTGAYLHVFALLPPPKEFVQKRFDTLRRLPRSPDVEFAKEKYLEILQSIDFDREILIREKADLLADLRHAGLRSDQDADFIFFQFRNELDQVAIDVVAAKSAGIPPDADDRNYLACIERMARVAERHFKLNSPVAAVVRDMTLSWDVRVSIQRAARLCRYIKSFVNNITPDA